MLCSSTRSRLSTTRCSLKALRGIKFCGKHAKSKTKTLWKPDLTEDESATKIQRVWRGWMVRHFLYLAGHSIDYSGHSLRRSECHNEEELVTLEDKERQHPLNFFSFVENGKRWWFGLDTMFKLIQETNPSNPYTKEPFSRGTRIRIRELHDLAWYRKLHTTPETLHTKAVALCHILEDILFEEISYTRFEYMSKLSLIIFTSHVHRHIEARSIECASVIRRKHLFVIESCLTKQFQNYHLDFLLFQVISTLLFILRSSKNKFPVSFIIFGGLQQM